MACTFEGCDKPARSRGLCGGHYEQARGGKELAPLRHRGPTTFQYRLLSRPGHPLAAKARGGVLEHRLVLFERIGPGTHPCHHCGKPVTWMVDLMVDHLNDNKLDNVDTNLAPSCSECNTLRAALVRFDERKARYGEAALQPAQ